MTKTEKKAAPAAKGNWIVSNLIKAAVLVVVLLAGAMIFLNVFTKHNHEIIVPDFSNLTVEEATAVARQAGMRVEVTDSVFVKRMKKGASIKYAVLLRFISFHVHCALVMSLRDTAFFSAVFCDMYLFLLVLDFAFIYYL